jgi:hypothetical protein
VRLFDADGLDLTQMTPPLSSGVPNPRQIYGWHFRNAANTGANVGDVNAPQGLRLLGFDPALSGTGGYRPSELGGVDPSDQPGRAALTVRDYGLADLEAGGRARMVYLSFTVCLTWPTTERELALEARALEQFEASGRVTPELVEQMGACGLDLDAFGITPYLRPVELGGDFDGDDSLDVAVPVVRRADGKRAVAVCRAGTWLHLLGIEGRMGRHVEAAYFESIDGWALFARGPVGQGVAEGPPPALLGDAILIGKSDSSSALLYWDGADFNGYWQGD